MNDTALDKMYVEPQERVLDPSLADQSLIDRMPSPTGWRLLILPYRGKGKTEGGLYLPDKVVEDGGEVRILNDDEILAKIQEPEDILHF
jgi:hypothetical protein